MSQETQTLICCDVCKIYVCRTHEVRTSTQSAGTGWIRVEQVTSHAQPNVKRDVCSIECLRKLVL